MKSIFATLRESGSFTTFLDLIRAAGMEERLRTEGPYTLFVPDDDAFRAVPRSELDSILDDIDRLTDILNYHIVPGVSTSLNLPHLSFCLTLFYHPFSKPVAVTP